MHHLVFIIHIIKVCAQIQAVLVGESIAQFVVKHFFRTYPVFATTAFDTLFQVGAKRFTLSHGHRSIQAVAVIDPIKNTRFRIEKVVVEIARYVHQIVIDAAETIADVSVLNVAEQRELASELILGFGEKIEFSLFAHVSVPFVVFSDILIVFYPGQFAVMIAVVKTVRSAKYPVERIFGIG